jgi:hypothetical protein
VYSYVWLRDGVVSTASTSATLPASATTDGEVWAVEVSASDGLASGPLNDTSQQIVLVLGSLSLALVAGLAMELGLGWALGPSWASSLGFVTALWALFWVLTGRTP